MSNQQHSQASDDPSRETSWNWLTIGEYEYMQSKQVLKLQVILRKLNQLLGDNIHQQFRDQLETARVDLQNVLNLNLSYRRNAKHGSVRVRPDIKIKVRQMYVAGFTYRQIVKNCNVSQGYITVMAKREKINRNKVRQKELVK